MCTTVLASPVAPPHGKHPVGTDGKDVTALHAERTHFARSAAATVRLVPAWRPIVRLWLDLAVLTEARIALREAA
jgi:hypothetical protein